MQVLQKGNAANTSKKVKKQRKDDVLKMINSLEFCENSDTFRNLAKQFYAQNISNK